MYMAQFHTFGTATPLVQPTGVGNNIPLPVETLLKEASTVAPAFNKTLAAVMSTICVDPWEPVMYKDKAGVGTQVYVRKRSEWRQASRCELPA